MSDDLKKIIADQEKQILALEQERDALRTRLAYWEAADRLPKQAAEIDRVRGRIGEAVTKFWSNRVAPGMTREFHAEELRGFVEKMVPGAPSSPDRILRDLRRRRVINYTVLDRRRSYYRALPLRPVRWL